MVGKKGRQFAQKYSAGNTEQVKRAMTSDWWYENVLLDFIASYKLQNKFGPTMSAIKTAGVVPPARIGELTKKLLDDGWITTWDNKYKHFEAAIAY